MDFLMVFMLSLRDVVMVRNPVIFGLVLLFWSLCMWIHPQVLLKLVNWMLMNVTMTIIISMSSIKTMSCHILMFMVDWLMHIPFCVVHSGA